MNILHTVQSYLPQHHGMSEVTRQISERLVKKGHRVVVATSSCPERKENTINGVEIVDFDIRGNITNGIQGEYDQYIRFIREHPFDVMTNFAAQQWASDLVFPFLPELKRKKIFVPTGFSGLYANNYQSYYKHMKNWMKQYDMNVFLSNDYRDVNFARLEGIEKRILIPNGAAADEFLSGQIIDIREKLGIKKDTYLLLHVGMLTGIKGQFEAIKIFSEANIKNAALVLVSTGFSDYKIHTSTMVKNILRLFLGKQVNQSQIESLAAARYSMQITNHLNQKKIYFTALSRAETVAIYHSADAFLFPSGIECSPIVLFECAASHTPFLSSDVGNAREIAEWTKSGIILPTHHDLDGMGLSHVDVQASARIVEDLYRNPTRAAKMAENGFSAWKQQFTWEKIADQYETLYDQLLHS